MNLITPVAGPGLGLWIPDMYAWMMVRGGNVTKGDVMAVDITDTDTGTTVGSALGSEASTFSNMIVPITATLIDGIFGIAMDTANDDTRVRFLFAGFVSVNSPAQTVGLRYGAANASRVLVATAATTKSIAIALETSATNPSLKVNAFSGIGGFGNAA